MADRIGQRFGEYRLIRFLGKGSFGDVYLGEHLHDNTWATIKVLQARLTNEDLKEFINEASTTFRLKHLHIVQLLDFGVGANDGPLSNFHCRSECARATRHKTQKSHCTIIHLYLLCG